MRNASDIFFLKEDAGDAGHIFSVNGSCPLRIRRRKQIPQNDCFEYGRSKTELIEDQTLRAQETLDDNENDERGEYYELPSIDPEKITDNILEDNREVVELQSETKMKTKEKNLQSLTSSNMTRNILTGAGMEILKHRKSKKGSNRKEKALW